MRSISTSTAAMPPSCFGFSLIWSRPLTDISGGTSRRWRSGTSTYMPAARGWLESLMLPENERGMARNDPRPHAGRLQGVDVSARQGLADKNCPGKVPDGLGNGGEFGRVLRRVLQLYYERGAAPGEAGPAEGLNRRTGILAGGIGVQVEQAKEEERGRGEPEPRAGRGRVPAGPLEPYGVRHGEDRDRRLEGDRVAHEVARAPDLVEVVERGHPGVRELGKLPGKVADVVFTPQEPRAVVVVDVARDRRIDMDDVDAVRVGLLQPARIGRVAEPVSAVELERDKAGRDGRGVGGPRHAPGGLADAEVGGEESDDVHPGPRVGAGEGYAIGAFTPGEIIDPLPRSRLDRRDQIG